MLYRRYEMKLLLMLSDVEGILEYLDKLRYELSTSFYDPQEDNSKVLQLLDSDEPDEVKSLRSFVEECRYN